MRIESLYIDGFGHFTQSAFGPFDAPINIFYGENEAGKTTLLGFIRAILFGFRTQSHDEFYHPYVANRAPSTVEYPPNFGFTIHFHSAYEGIFEIRCKRQSLLIAGDRPV